MNKFVHLLEDPTRPGVEGFGGYVHQLWHGANFGLVDRRKMMCQVSTVLLSELGDDRVIDEEHLEANRLLMDDVSALRHDPENLERKLLADALYGALRIVTSASDPKQNMSAGVMVYGPLFMLAGVLIANKAGAMKPRRSFATKTALVRFKREFIRSHDGSDYGWQKAAAAKFAVSVSTIGRNCK